MFATSKYIGGVTGDAKQEDPPRQVGRRRHLPGRLAQWPVARTRHLHLGRRSQVSAAWVPWEGRGRSRPRQSTSRHTGEAGAAGGGVCVPVSELSLVVDARRGLCEGMRVRAWRGGGD